VFFVNNIVERINRQHNILSGKRGTRTPIKYCLINLNKLSLVGMQLPEKYKENFDVSSECPSSGITSED
jgi:hypothetical protein